MKTRASWWKLAAGMWAALILVVSVIPAEDLPSVSIWEADKVFHALVYLLLTILIGGYFLKRPVNLPGNLILLSIALCILYGFLIELIQLVLPTRSFDLYDALANSIGCLLAFPALLYLRGRPKKA